MCKQGHNAVLRGRKCPKCKKRFLICGSCDRGHVYCSKACSRAARLESKRRSNHRYRRKDWGRLNHRDSERAGRARKRNGIRSVGVQTSEVMTGSVRVPMPVLYDAVVARMSSNGGESGNEELCCSICGRPGRFVCFDKDFRQGSRAKRGFRMRC